MTGNAVYVTYLEDQSHIDWNGYITSNFTIVLTFPMFPSLIWIFYISCKDMHDLCTKAQGQPHSKNDRFTETNNVSVNNAQSDTVRLESIEVENKENSENIEVVNSNETGITNEDYNSLNEVQGEFANLIKAWSPLLFTVFSCECVMLINTGFVLSKYFLLGDGLEHTEQIIWACLFLQSVIIIIVICNVAERTHNRVQDYSCTARYVFGFYACRI